MDKARKPRRMRPEARTFAQCLREFLTAAVWKQARQAGKKRKRPRWDVHRLVLVLLMMTWACGDSLPEKFEVARGFYAVCCPKRRRPGKTFQGFQQALERLPMSVLRAIAAGVRGRLEALLGSRWLVDGFLPLGCDGSRLECPRSEELEKRLGKSGKRNKKRKNSKGSGKGSSKKDSAPTVWITALVHLGNGVPWAWRFGKGGKASERDHLCRMLGLLPQLALVVTDAGYYGYELILTLVRAKVDFLIRMSTNVKLYTEERVELEAFREGVVYYWPEALQKKGAAPIRARLIRLGGKSKKRKYDVWLLTNVMDPKRLSRPQADRFYRWRWESEGYFRTYKQTMKKLKLRSRTVRCVHREAEASMIATQLLLAQGALALPKPSRQQEPVLCSPRQVLVEIRREMRRATLRRNFRDRLRRARRERRVRTTGKEKRVWPRRKHHKPPGPPKILTLTKAQKCLLSRCETAA
jgi:hypothetical protein